MNVSRSFNNANLRMRSSIRSFVGEKYHRRLMAHALHMQTDEITHQAKLTQIRRIGAELNRKNWRDVSLTLISMALFFANLLAGAAAPHYAGMIACGIGMTSAEFAILLRSAEANAELNRI